MPKSLFHWCWNFSMLLNYILYNYQCLAYYHAHYCDLSIEIITVYEVNLQLDQFNPSIPIFWYRARVKKMKIIN